MHVKSFKDYNSMGQVISLYYSHVPTNLGGFVMKNIKRHIISIVSGTTVGAIVTNASDSTGAGIATGLAVGGLVEIGLKNRQIQIEIDVLENELNESRAKYTESIENFDTLTKEHAKSINTLKETETSLGEAIVISNDLEKKVNELTARNKDLTDKYWESRKNENDVKLKLQDTEELLKATQETLASLLPEEKKPKADPKEKQPKAEQKKQKTGKPKQEKPKPKQEKPKTEESEA